MVDSCEFGGNAVGRQGGEALESSKSKSNKANSKKSKNSPVILISQFISWLLFLSFF